MKIKITNGHVTLLAHTRTNMLQKYIILSLNQQIQHYYREKVENGEKQIWSESMRTK